MKQKQPKIPYKKAVLTTESQNHKVLTMTFDQQPASYQQIYKNSKQTKNNCVFLVAKRDSKFHSNVRLKISNTKIQPSKFTF